MHKIKNNQKGFIGVSFVASIFFIVGLTFLIFGIKSTFNTLHLISTGIKTTGIITEVIRKRDSKGNTTFAPVFKYFDQKNKSYELQSSVSSSSYSNHAGQKVEVIYDPQKPWDAKINSFVHVWFSSIVSMIMGLIFSALGGAILYSTIQDQRKRKYLSQFGTKIEAEIINVDTIKRNKKRDYWIIQAQWQNPRDHKIYLFESDSIYFNPEKYLSKKAKIIIDPNNPNRYMYDAESLPKLG